MRTEIIEEGMRTCGVDQGVRLGRVEEIDTSNWPQGENKEENL